jgi:hypothetical protein
MTATQLPLAAAQRHNNQQLFSDYFLDRVLPARPDWKLLVEQATPVRDAIARIYAAFTPSTVEAQTEDDLIKPVLRVLGHSFEVQPALKTPSGTKKPDYVFYQGAAALQINKGLTLDEARLAQGALAVGDAKHWDRPLDQAIKGLVASEINAHPGIQIDYYIRHSGLAWGILTNGRRWRLYHKATSGKLDRFYEVDLPLLLESGSVEAFLYFYAFFHRSAFDAHSLGLERMLRESGELARGIGDTLKAQVYDALRHLAQGFLDYEQNLLRPDPATLKQIYDGSLIVLYRLLFILYAEARELLPLRESERYREDYSLSAITREVARRLQQQRPLLSTSGKLWGQLKELFAIIDRGSPPLKVATFNGGLFDGEKHPLLERFTIGDNRLEQAIDKLARAQGQFIDYRDLAERHLGTVYEGLLEYQLVPLEQPEDVWSVALVNARGERKSSGSYYTPDFVVQYIVDATVGPLLRAAVAGKSSDAEKVQAILNVNVADLAMGSGHFPVAACEYIARFIVEEAISPQGDAAGETDLQYWKRRVAQSCIYGVDLNPLAVELAKLSMWLTTAAKGRPLSFLDHHLRCGNALVGARVADLRVGTPAAKLKQPSKKQAAQRAAGQLSMLDDEAFARSMSTAVDSMWLIEDNPGNTIAEVREQERLYAQLQAELTRTYGQLADLATATRFGLLIDAGLWQPLADYARGKSLAAPPRFEAWLEQAARFAADGRYFHYELAFPEVFFDRFGRSLGALGGFDAIVGNPPYVRQEELAPLKPYFADEYGDVYAGTADLFVYFFAQGLRLLRENGRLAYIASNSWLRANYAAPLRAFLRQQATVEQLIDLGDNRVFADAPDVYPAIHLVRRAVPPAEHRAEAASFSRGEGVKNFATQVRAKLAPVSIHDQADTGWQLGADAGRKLFAKLMAKGRALGEVVDGKMYRGVTTGLNDVFIVDRATRDRLVEADPSSVAILKPFIQGEDLRPWYYEDQDRWLIFARRGISIDNFPVVKAYLEQFRTQLEPRPRDRDSDQPWPGRKPGSYRWYELQDSVDYFTAFEQPKILWPDITKLPRFSWDSEGMYLGNTGYIAIPDHPWVLGFLSSRCAWFMISNTAIALGERTGIMRYRLIDQYIRPLPIPDAAASERAAIGDLALRITDVAKARYGLHRRARRRVLSDLGTTGKGLNQKLTAWWELDFGAFRGEIQKVFKQDIPLKQRDDWEEWLLEQRATHAQHTATIMALETELNARVYALFDLAADEIALIAASTRYRYGEV